MPRDRSLEILARFALEEVGDAARHVRALAGNADERSALARFEPDPAALAGPVHDAMIDAAQRRHRARLERNRRRQTGEPRADPCRVTLGEFARRFER